MSNPNRVLPGTGDRGGQYTTGRHLENGVAVTAGSAQRVGDLVAEVAARYGLDDDEANSCVDTYTSRFWIAHGTAATYAGTGGGAPSDRVLTTAAMDAVLAGVDDHVDSGEGMVDLDGATHPASAVLTCPQCAATYHEADATGRDPGADDVGCPVCADRVEQGMAALYAGGAAPPTATDMSAAHADGVHAGRYHQGCPQCAAQVPR